MPEYMRLDSTTLLNIAVLATFALLTGSLIVSILAIGIPFRLRVVGPAWAFERPVIADGRRSQHFSPARAPANGRAGEAGSPPPVPMTVDSVPRRPVALYGPVEYFRTPMIPGAWEPHPLTTFGLPPVVVEDALTTMDATTIAARQREGGGAPSERRPRRQGSTLQRLMRTQRQVTGIDRT